MEDHYRALVESSYDPIVVTDELSGVIYASPSISALYGWTPDDLLGTYGFDYVHPDDMEPALQHGVRANDNLGARYATEIRLRTADGNYLWTELTTINLSDDPLIGGFVHNYRDISARKAAEAALRAKDERLRHLVENADGAILLLDDRARMLWVSPGAERLWGAEPGTLSGLGMLRRIHPESRGEMVTQYGKMVESPSGTKVHCQIRMRHTDRTYRWYEGTYTNCLADPAVGGIVVNIRDATERVLTEQALRESEVMLEYQATHDPLTDLPNRTLLFERMEAAVRNGTRRGTGVAVLFCDLDNFKFINDSHGHAMGDELLRVVARRLRKGLPKGDTAARFGGDEFVLLIEGLEDPNEAIALAERVSETLRAPLPTTRGDMYITTSIGVAYVDTGDESPGELIRDADLAMYAAKERGRNRVEVFDGAMRARVLEWHETERSLRGALDRGELAVHYQPIVDMANGKIVAVEALIRWHHPERGLLFPVDFIGVAEQTGLVIQIGSFVVNESCDLLASLDSGGPGMPPARRKGRPYEAAGAVAAAGRPGGGAARAAGGTAAEAGAAAGERIGLAINLSARQLADEGLADELLSTFARTGVDPSRITVEVTESELMRDIEHTTEMLMRLKAIGVKVAIDDFGTGHSSFSYLGALPVDVLKIDRSFVDAIDGYEGDAGARDDNGTRGDDGLSGGDGARGDDVAPVRPQLALVRTIIELGHILALDVIAEGVETDEQDRQLLASHCDYAQGFKYAMPMSAEALRAMLASRKPE